MGGVAFLVEHAGALYSKAAKPSVFAHTGDDR